MKSCFIVTMKNLSDPKAQEFITRVFTKREDAKIFVQDCKKHEKGAKNAYRYYFRHAELDGDPLSGFFFNVIED